MNATDALTIDHPNFSNDTITLEPSNGGRAVVVCRRQWLAALPLAALNGWNIQHRAGPDGPRYFGGAGQVLTADTTKAIGVGIRRGVHGIVNGEVDPDEMLETRYTVLDIQKSNSQYADTYLLAPYLELSRLVRQAGAVYALQHPTIAALLQLADVLEGMGEATMTANLPPDWMHPHIPTARVVANAHPGGAGCCYQLAGRARAAGDVVRVPAASVDMLEAEGIARRLTPSEAEALDNPAPVAVAEKPKKRTFRQKLADVVAGE